MIGKLRFTRFLTVFLLLAMWHSAQATTWDEPWHETVVPNAQSLVLGVVTEVDSTKKVEVNLIRHIAGEEVKSKFRINGFSLLELCSASGHGPEFEFGVGDTVYFFLNSGEGKGYRIATPTTGFAKVENGEVFATYRHSYHQALVSQELYEWSQRAIFQGYHGGAWDTARVRDFIEEQLSLRESGMGEDELETFFTQHVALELMYHLRYLHKPGVVVGWMMNGENYHTRISAARALRNPYKDHVIDQFLRLLKDEEDNFFLVVLIRSLAELDIPDFYQVELEAVLANLSDEEASFGGNLMDPRVCTSLPSPREAMQALLDKL